MRRPSSAHGGFATIVALFLLVVLAALGAFMVSISTSQQVGSAQDVQGTRAYWAARAGLEWGIGSLTASPGACPTPPAPFTVEGFTLSVSCSSASFDEGGTARVVYSLTSRASLGGAAGSLAFVERSVSAAVEF
ncbi:MAG: hypothetical protein KA164_03400 [Rhodoferax sp.]|jgi:MSHA biogenesis protein MshP|nr:hypothetical protein [Rhodoferax sp.]